MTNIDLIAWRRSLHQYPELSGHEAQTAARVTEALRALSPDQLVTDVGGHGVIAQFNGAAPRCKVLLRCELDALPIPEVNTFDYRSNVPGHGHLCGHDGHMAILLGVAQQLAQSRPNGCDVALLFQPAEETGAGAKAVIEDPRFAPFRPDFSVALHNMPGVPLGQTQVRAGTFSCASRGLRVQLSGRAAHAAQPETGLSPASAMARFMQAIPAMNTPAVPGSLPDRMVTLTHAQLGEPTFGVAPSEAQVWVTLRTQTDAQMAALCAQAEALAAKLAREDGLDMRFDYDDVFLASENDPTVVAAIQSAAAQISADIAPQSLPMRPSEDFGRFGHISQAAMFLLGAGLDCPALHSPDYDFPDTLIGPGIAMFMQVIDTLSGQAATT